MNKYSFKYTQLFKTYSVHYVCTNELSWHPLNSIQIFPQIVWWCRETYSKNVLKLKFLMEMNGWKNKVYSEVTSGHKWDNPKFLVSIRESIALTLTVVFLFSSFFLFVFVFLRECQLQLCHHKWWLKWMCLSVSCRGHARGRSAAKRPKAPRSAARFLSAPMLTNWAVYTGSSMVSSQS